MSIEVLVMPKMGEMMEEGSVIEWIVEGGDSVSPGMPMVVVSTDKVDIDVESQVAGRVTRLIAQEGETLPVGAPLCEIETGA